MITPKRLWHAIMDRLERLGGREPAVLVLLLLIAVLTWGFIELAELVTEGETGHFDRWLVRSMRQADNPAELIGPEWVQEAGRDATALGGYCWLVFFTVATTGFLWLDQKRHLAMFLFGSAVSGYIVSTILKQIFQRPRPDIVPHLSFVQSSSFPSGHSMNSAVVFLTLGAIVAASVGQKRLKAYVIVVAMMITFLVGISRVYLGVHYPTDVLAGWIAGLIWAVLCWLVAHWLQVHGRMECPISAEERPLRVSRPIT